MTMIPVKVQDLKNSQVFYAKDQFDVFHDFKVWQAPSKNGGKWTVECTDSGDYCYEFTEDDDNILFINA